MTSWKTPAALACLAFLAVLVLAIVAACRADPLTCSNDGTCPTGYLCEVSGCVQTSDCAQQLPNDDLCMGCNGCDSGMCLYGVCTPTPNQGLCPSDHPVHSGPACMRACDADGGCPRSLACDSVWNTGDGGWGKACVYAGNLALEGTFCQQPEEYQCIDDAGNGIPWLVCVEHVCTYFCWNNGNGVLECPPGYVCAKPNLRIEEACFPSCNNGNCRPPLICDTEAGACLAPQ